MEFGRTSPLQYAAVWAEHPGAAPSSLHHALQAASASARGMAAVPGSGDVLPHPNADASLAVKRITCKSARRTSTSFSPRQLLIFAVLEIPAPGPGVVDVVLVKARAHADRVVVSMDVVVLRTSLIETQIERGGQTPALS